MAVAQKSARFRATAERLISENATPAVIRQIENAGDEWSPVQVETDTDCEVTPDKKTMEDQSGSLVGVDTRKYLVSTSAGIVPSKGDKMAFRTRKAQVTNATQFFEIVKIETIDLGEADIVYQVLVAT